MSFEILFVFAVLAGAVVLFVSEWLSFDQVALLVLCALFLGGILGPEEALAGFSNQATVTIAAMFVLAEGMRRTGALSAVGDAFVRLGDERPRVGIAVMMLTVAVLSAFINNTAAIAIFIPVVLTVAERMGVSASKLLLPVSFASMFGGVSSLIGTSTNILVSSIAEQRGLEPFGMFEMTPLGAVLAVLGFAYLLLIGIPLLPERRQEADSTRSFGMNRYLTDVVLGPAFHGLGQPAGEITLGTDLDLDILQVVRRGEGEDAPETAGPDDTRMLRENDVLRVRGGPREIDRLLEREDVAVLPAAHWEDADLRLGERSVVEAVVAPDSSLEGEAIKAVDFPGRFGAIVLAVRTSGAVEHDDLGAHRLRGGDSVLLSLDKERVREVENDRAFVLASTVALPSYRKGRMPLAAGILVAVVLGASLTPLPIVATALAGSLAMVLTGCVTAQEAYRAINWKVIVLLAGVLPLGVAMDQTGAARLLSDQMLDLLGAWGPLAVLSGFFLVTVLLTGVMSNQASAALLAPVAIEAARALEVSERPMLMAVTFAASLSFMTPVGYQTNTLVYGPGQYRFTDFTKVGTPLDLLFWGVATLMIPLVWPF